MTEYKEFLAFKAMKARAAAEGLSSLTCATAVREDLTGFSASVRAIDWTRSLDSCLRFIFNLKAKSDVCSPNVDWWLWRQIYIADPAAFRLLGELHNDRESGESYITARYDFGPSGAYASFHLYGTTEGFKFNVTKATWSQNGKRISKRLLWSRSVSDCSSSVISE